MRGAIVLPVVGVAALVAFPTVQVRAQSDAKPLAFEAASIKRNTSGADSGGDANFQPGGRFVARNTTVRALIRGAFADPVQLDPSRMAGGPSWIDVDRFDVQARAATEFPDLTFSGGSTMTGASMLRALLADRFRLATHWETRVIPVYTLVRRDPTRLSPRLVSSSGTPGTDCLPAGAVASADDRALPRCGSYLLQNTGGNQFAIHARGITMTNFARNLQNVAGRVVQDRTALTGPYSFDLDFEYRPPSATSPDDGLGAAIFTAVQEQLGLKLESRREPMDVLVVDHVERPTPD